jgi:hypothetical protein
LTAAIPDASLRARANDRALWKARSARAGSDSARWTSPAWIRVRVVGKPAQVLLDTRERLLAAYREAVAAQRSPDTFAECYARERLAILEGDVDAIVKLLGGDQTTPYQFIRVAEAMAELGLDDQVLAWSTRGIAQTSGWQVAQLYDLACGVHARREQPIEVLALRRSQHERMPSTSTYRALRTAAEALEVWPVERDAARATLQRTDPRAFVDALLDDADVDLAWSTAVAAGPQNTLGFNLWLRLAENRERDHPADAIPVYQRLTEEVLQRADRRGLPLRRMDPAASTGRRRGRRQDRRIRRIPHTPTRAAPATAHPDRNPRQSRTPLI